MNKETKIIGDKKEKSKLEELVKSAKNDPMIKDIIERAGGRDYETIEIPGFEVLKFKQCEKADKLIESIEDEIGFNEERKLIKQKSSFNGIYKTSINVSNSALLALCYFASGKKEDGNWIIRQVEENIGFFEHKDGTKLIKDYDRVSSSHSLHVDSNALLAIAYFANGEKEKGLELLDHIKKYMYDKKWYTYWFRFNKKTRLIERKNDYNTNYETDGNDNAALALAYIISGEKKKGLNLLDNVDKYIAPFYKTNIALLGLAYLACGAINKGLELIADAENATTKSNLFVLDDGMSDIVTNATLALAYMAEAYYKDENEQGKTYFNPLPLSSELKKK